MCIRFEELDLDLDLDLIIGEIEEAEGDDGIIRRILDAAMIMR